MDDFRFDLPSSYNASAILFDNLEAGRGGKVAIRCGDATVSYGDICDVAARVGNGLRDLAVAAGSRVLLLLLDTPRFPAAFFGTMRAGYEIEGAVEIIEGRLPAVITCDKGLNEPRLPSLRGIMQAKKKPLDTWTLERAGLEAAALESPMLVWESLCPATRSAALYRPPMQQEPMRAFDDNSVCP